MADITDKEKEQIAEELARLVEAHERQRSSGEKEPPDDEAGAEKSEAKKDEDRVRGKKRTETGSDREGKKDGRKKDPGSRKKNKSGPEKKKKESGSASDRMEQEQLDILAKAAPSGGLELKVVTEDKKAGKRKTGSRKPKKKKKASAGEHGSAGENSGTADSRVKDGEKDADKKTAADNKDTVINHTEEAGSDTKAKADFDSIEEKAGRILGSLRLRAANISSSAKKAAAEWKAKQEIRAAERKKARAEAEAAAKAKAEEEAAAKEKARAEAEAAAKDSVIGGSGEGTIRERAGRQERNSSKQARHERKPEDEKKKRQEERARERERKKQKKAERLEARRRQRKETEDQGRAAAGAADPHDSLPAASKNEAPGKHDRRADRARHLAEEYKRSLLERNSKKIWTIIALVIILAFAALCFMQYAYIRLWHSDRYVASSSKDAGVYVIGETESSDGGVPSDEGDAATEVLRIKRGTQVTALHGTRRIGDVVYRKVERMDIAEAAEKTPDETAEKAASKEPGGEALLPEGDLYLREDNLADEEKDVVQEREVFVRTPATIYKEADGPSIASFAPKGSCLKVTGYDMIKDDGSINKYKVEYPGEDGSAAEGYVYGKYMTDTQEKADAVYNGGGIYDKAVKDKYGYNLYGGKASDLDYYPYEKPRFEDNEFCRHARAMYLNCAAAVNPDAYAELIKKTDCNAVVVDIKDGVLAYKSEVAKELSPRSYKTAYASAEDYRAGIDELRDTGAYLIGRIVVFNDPIYAKDHPENCIRYRGDTSWPSAYSRGVWEFNVKLAREAVEEFGFNEIQFDYVRFPESSYDMSKSGKADFRNKYDEKKGQAVQNFCFYAADQIHDAGAYFSVDVFGESAYGYMTAYGQYWPGISNIVDAISAMPYTDHMGADGAWENPYGTMKAWARKARKQQAKLEDPAAARTWITGYDTPHWNPVVNYGNKQLRAQVRALEEQGLDGGYIPWNSGSSLAKYRQYKKVWNE